MRVCDNDKFLMNMLSKFGIICSCFDMSILSKYAQSSCVLWGTFFEHKNAMFMCSQLGLLVAEQGLTLSDIKSPK
jgi:hypothetical protein